MTDRHRQALLASLVASSEQLMKACNVARDAGQDELCPPGERPINVDGRRVACEATS